MPATPTCSALFSLLSLVSLGGCTGWQAVQLTPASFSPPPAEMRVTRLDGWQAVLVSPRFEKDTIRGRRADEPYDSIVMPASQTRSVAVPMREERATITSIGVLAGFITIFAGIMTVGSHGCGS